MKLLSTLFLVIVLTLATTGRETRIILNQKAHPVGTHFLEDCSRLVHTRCAVERVILEWAKTDLVKIATPNETWSGWRDPRDICVIEILPNK